MAEQECCGCNMTLYAISHRQEFFPRLLMYGHSFRVKEVFEKIFSKEITSQLLHECDVNYKFERRELNVLGTTKTKNFS